ncbi:MAG: hypothetical protein JNK15_19545 [Planctomycetes bacterium]|nr:hypothetical protein [Planctomycetota bacterium]
MLLSVEAADLRVLTDALATLPNHEVQAVLANLKKSMACARNDGEVVDAWADGASVQVRVITVWGDPVDMGSDEARDLAAKILAAAKAAD